jgi:phosphatidylinositol-3-phosphatase
MLLLLENHEYADVIGNSAAPSLNALAARYGLATRSYACCHPSLPNYLDLVAGSSFGISSDCTTCSVDATTIADQMVQSGRDWRAYMEAMPSACFKGDSAAGLYAKKHDPFMYFAHIRNDPAACARVQPFSGFYAALDAGQLPAYTFVTPNLCDDGHDCSLRRSDTWVSGFVSRVTASAWFSGGGVLIITYDEGTSSDGCCQGAAGGHIPTWVVSAATPAGSRSATPVDHAGVLRTVEELYRLPLLGEAACACSGDLLSLIAH